MTDSYRVGALNAFANILQLVQNLVKLFKPAIRRAFDETDTCVTVKEAFNQGSTQELNLLKDIIPAYRTAVDQYIQTPAMTRVELKKAHEKLMQSKLIARNAASSEAILKKLHKDRVETLMQALEVIATKRRKAWGNDKDAESDPLIRAKVTNLKKAFREIASLLRSTVNDSNVLKLGINLEEVG